MYKGLIVKATLNRGCFCCLKFLNPRLFLESVAIGPRRSGHGPDRSLPSHRDASKPYVGFLVWGFRGGGGPGFFFERFGQGWVLEGCPWSRGPSSRGLWSSGPAVLWSPGPLVPRSSGPVVLRSRGPLVPWFSGPVVLWSCGPLVPSSSSAVVSGLSVLIP